MKYISGFFAVLVLAGAVQAAPAAQATPSGSENEEQFQKEAWKLIDAASFKEKSLEHRLQVHANHKVYDAEQTLNCIRECIIPNKGYPMEDATYGEVCKSDQNLAAMQDYLYGDVGHCMHENEQKRRELQNWDNSNDSNGQTACSQAFEYFQIKIDDMCAFITQKSRALDYLPYDSWE